MFCVFSHAEQVSGDFVKHDMGGRPSAFRRLALVLS
jgi:hypothetical protein